MMDTQGVTIYVGKAKNLKKRVSQYFTKALDVKTQSMVSLIHDIQVTITPSELDALLLENNLIKQLKPKYNIQFKDDKSYPVIYVNTNHEFPSIKYFVGKISSSTKGKFYGPFPNRYSAKSSADLIQKIFKIRNCSDGFFRNRSRPCLQYQILRCDAPCVGYITKQDYMHNVKSAMHLLEGKKDIVLQELKQQMIDASDKLDFEKASTLRDQISMIRDLHSEQLTSDLNQSKLNIDVIGFVGNEHNVSFHLLKIRAGLIIESKNFVISKDAYIALNDDEYLEKFVFQYYSKLGMLDEVKELVIQKAELELSLIQEFFNSNFNKKLKVVFASNNKHKDWLEVCQKSAKQALKNAKYSEKKVAMSGVKELLDLFSFDVKDFNIVCFDVSHLQGSATVASAVVFDSYGARRDCYRTFNIKHSKKSDDYASMKEAVSRFMKNPSCKPSILLIDGGRGQLGVVDSIENLPENDDITLLSISKGENRKAGLEKIWIKSGSSYYNVELPEKAFWLLIKVRDEAHRFSITRQRVKLRNKSAQSELTSIEGVGEKLRVNLIHHFGGMEALKKASVADITKVPRVSKELANKIFNYLNGLD